jgi:glucose/arabinose dehydrogenase
MLPPRTRRVGGPAPNFGWPCFEGAEPQPAYQAAGLDVCSRLYASPASVTPPALAYSHDREVADGDGCGTGNSAITGLAFYPGGAYPEAYQGALFFADFSRQCIWVVPPDARGAPDPAQRRPFAVGAAGPVDLEVGPDGELYYVDYGGTVRRIAYAGSTRVHAVHHR